MLLKKLCRTHTQGLGRQREVVSDLFGSGFEDLGLLQQSDGGGRDGVYAHRFHIMGTINVYDKKTKPL